MEFSLLEIDISKDVSFITIFSFGYRSLFYIEFSNGKLEQLDLFFMKVFLEDKWKK